MLIVINLFGFVLVLMFYSINISGKRYNIYRFLTSLSVVDTFLLFFSIIIYSFLFTHLIGVEVIL
jgi:hypothetical protein